MDESRFQEILAVVLANIAYQIHKVNVELNYRREAHLSDVAEYGASAQLLGGADVTTMELDDFDAMFRRRYGLQGGDSPNLKRIREKAAKERKQQEDLNAARKTALSKLTPAERKALGLDV